MKLADLLWITDRDQQVWLQHRDGRYVYCGAAGDVLWRVATMCNVVSIGTSPDNSFVLVIAVEEVKP